MLKHNMRVWDEKGAPAHIDVTRTPLNYCLIGQGSPQSIATEAKVLMLRAGIETPRKNAVMGVDVIFSLPINRHQQDTRPFFEDCLAWTQQTFDGELLSFITHNDESAPHAHAIILPLVDGKLQGNQMVGNKGNLYRLINDFHKQVGSKHGLSKNQSKRLNENDKQSLVKAIHQELSNDPLSKSKVWPIVRDHIQAEPLLYTQHLGLKVTHTTSKTFAGIMTSKGKGSSMTP